MKKKTYIAPVAEMEFVRVEKGFQLSCCSHEPLGETDGSYTEQLGPGGSFLTKNISGSKSNMA